MVHCQGCMMLETVKSAMALRALDDDEKSYLSRKQVGLNPGKDMLIINEPGL